MSQQPPPEPSPSVMRFGDLKKLIADMVAGATNAASTVGKELTGAGDNTRQPLRDQVRGARQQSPARSVDDEVAAALAKIEADKARQAREDARDKDINELKERTKEKAPVERSRLHRFMGWGD